MCFPVEYRLRPRLLADYSPPDDARATHFVHPPAKPGTATKCKCPRRMLSVHICAVAHGPPAFPGPVTTIAKLANEKRTSSRMSDTRVQRFKVINKTYNLFHQTVQQQLRTVAEREQANAQMLQSFINDFIDTDMAEADGLSARPNVSTTVMQPSNRCIVCRRINARRCVNSACATCNANVPS